MPTRSTLAVSLSSRSLRWSLYRPLLAATSTVPLEDQHRQALREYVRDEFRRNRKMKKGSGAGARWSRQSRCAFLLISPSRKHVDPLLPQFLHGLTSASHSATHIDRMRNLPSYLVARSSLSPPPPPPRPAPPKPQLRPSILHSTHFHPPMQRLRPQPLSTSMMIFNRRKASQKRFDKVVLAKELIELGRHEQAFEQQLGAVPSIAKGQWGDEWAGWVKEAKQREAQEYRRNEMHFSQIASASLLALASTALALPTPATGSSANLARRSLQLDPHNPSFYKRELSELELERRKVAELMAEILALRKRADTTSDLLKRTTCDSCCSSGGSSSGGSTSGSGGDKGVSSGAPTNGEGSTSGGTSSGSGSGSSGSSSGDQGSSGDSSSLQGAAASATAPAKHASTSSTACSKSSSTTAATTSTTTAARQAATSTSAAAQASADAGASGSASGGISGELKGHFESCAGMVKGLGEQIAADIKGAGGSSTAIAAAVKGHLGELRTSIAGLISVCGELKAQSGASLDVSVVASLLVELFAAVQVALNGILSLGSQLTAVVALLATELVAIAAQLLALFNLLVAIVGVELKAAVKASLDTSVSASFKTLGFTSLTVAIGI
ncbi:hypothetical protein JCM10207_003616 [Rhodosporidiobolus poonsookiae]